MIITYMQGYWSITHINSIGFMFWPGFTVSFATLDICIHCSLGDWDVGIRGIKDENQDYLAEISRFHICHNFSWTIYRMLIYMTAALASAHKNNFVILYDWEFLSVTPVYFVNSAFYLWFLARLYCCNYLWRINMSLHTYISWDKCTIHIV